MSKPQRAQQAVPLQYEIIFGNRYKLAAAHDSEQRPLVSVNLPKDKTKFREVKGEAFAI